MGSSAAKSREKLLRRWSARHGELAARRRHCHRLVMNEYISRKSPCFISQRPRGRRRQRTFLAHAAAGINYYVRNLNITFFPLNGAGRAAANIS